MKKRFIYFLLFFFSKAESLPDFWQKYKESTGLEIFTDLRPPTILRESHGRFSQSLKGLENKMKRIEGDRFVSLEYIHQEDLVVWFSG